MTEATRYPLSWPFGWKRTVYAARVRAKFSKGTTQYNNDMTSSWRSKSDLTVPQGLLRLKAELERLGARSSLVSSNVELNSYGEPRGGRRSPDDPGVAVYFELNKKDRVLACDRFDRVADNMAAIAAHIHALRAIDRYGVGTLDQAFAGYDALPPPSADNRPPWRTILGFKPDTPVKREDIDVMFKARARVAHPDMGGSDDAMAALNAARDAALRELGQ